MPTLIEFDPAPVKLEKPVESVGVKSAVKTFVLLIALGVHVQLAV